jgi:hypothetical protein
MVEFGVFHFLTLKQNTKWGLCTQKVKVIYLEEVRCGRYCKLGDGGVYLAICSRKTYL